MFSFLYHCKDFDRTWLYTWVTRRVSYKKQELLTFREHMGSAPVFGGVRVAHRFSFLCWHSMCLYILSSVLRCPLRFPHKTVFGLSIPPVVCRRARVLFMLFAFACVSYCPTHIVLHFFYSFFVVVLCTQCCQFLWLVHSWLPLRFSLTFIYWWKKIIMWRQS